MTVEQGSALAHVKIRAPGRDWMPLVVAGLIWVTIGAAGAVAAQGVVDQGWDMLVVLDWGLAVLGFVIIAEALWIRGMGVDLTPELARVRYLRRRDIPWHQVQAVVRSQLFGSWRVRLILENGDKVTLRAPTTFFEWGCAEYERDFHQIGQWWLAHRGESWLPVRPEAPRSPSHG